MIVVTSRLSSTDGATREIPPSTIVTESGWRVRDVFVRQSWELIGAITSSVRHDSAFGPGIRTAAPTRPPKKLAYIRQPPSM